MSDTHELLRFGVFELNLTTEELRKSGTLLKLSPQPFKLLAFLVRRSGQIVTREDIQRQLWGGETYVDFEQGMNHCIKQIRSALSDSADRPLYVETIPRRGYRFLAPVVSKTILAPAPRVIESQSGIQSSIAVPAIRPVPESLAVKPAAQPAEPAMGQNSKQAVQAPVAVPVPEKAATADPGPGATEKPRHWILWLGFGSCRNRGDWRHRRFSVLAIAKQHGAHRTRHHRVGGFRQHYGRAGL